MSRTEFHGDRISSFLFHDVVMVALVLAGVEFLDLAW
jgi:hypothetical protein